MPLLALPAGAVFRILGCGRLERWSAWETEWCHAFSLTARRNLACTSLGGLLAYGSPLDFSQLSVTLAGVEYSVTELRTLATARARIAPVRHPGASFLPPRGRGPAAFVQRRGLLPRRPVLRCTAADREGFECTSVRSVRGSSRERLSRGWHGRAWPRLVRPGGILELVTLVSGREWAEQLLLVGASLVRAICRMRQRFACHLREHANVAVRDRWRSWSVHMVEYERPGKFRCLADGIAAPIVSTFELRDSYLRPRRASGGGRDLPCAGEFRGELGLWFRCHREGVICWDEEWFCGGCFSSIRSFCAAAPIGPRGLDGLAWVCAKHAGLVDASLIAAADEALCRHRDVCRHLHKVPVNALVVDSDVDCESLGSDPW